MLQRRLIYCGAAGRANGLQLQTIEKQTEKEISRDVRTFKISNTKQRGGLCYIIHIWFKKSLFNIVKYFFCLYIRENVTDRSLNRGKSMIVLLKNPSIWADVTVPEWVHRASNFWSIISSHSTSWWTFFLDLVKAIFYFTNLTISALFKKDVWCSS